MIQHLISTDEPDDWEKRALCAQTDPEAFFPEKGGSTREAKQVCQTCEVREQCLQAALDNHERWGIWGGLSERERRRLDPTRACAWCDAVFPKVKYGSRKYCCSEECADAARVEKRRGYAARRPSRGAA